jgi:hypothetical protein
VTLGIDRDFDAGVARRRRCGTAARSTLKPKKRKLQLAGRTRHLDDVVLKISGVKHWLWRAVDQTGMVLDVLVQRRRDKQAAKRLLRKAAEEADATASRHDHRQACQPTARRRGTSCPALSIASTRD